VNGFPLKPPLFCLKKIGTPKSKKISKEQKNIIGLKRKSKIMEKM